MDSNECTIDGRDIRTKDAAEHVPTAPTRSPADPACPRCRGVGDIQEAGCWMYCVCVRRQDQAQRVKAYWPPDVLQAAGRGEVRRSVLEGRLRESLWIRTERDVLVAHLARALVVSLRIELVRVASDADLATAWLARVAGKVRDEEVREMSRDEADRFDRLEDLVLPPALLVVQLGVKAAALKDLPGLVMEAIRLRQQRSRPTWIVDTAAKPLAPGHLAHSDELAAMLATWGQVQIASAQEAGEKVDLAAGAAPKAEAPVHPEIKAWLDKHGITDYRPQGDRDRGAEIDHAGSTACGSKSVSIYWNKQRRSPSGKCSGKECPTKGKAAPAEDFLPTKEKPAGKTIGAQDLAQRLREILADGSPRPPSEVKRQFGERSYTAETLKRARKLAGVIASDESGQWTWQLPPDRSTSP